MKYNMNFSMKVEVPDETKYVLLYTKRNGNTGVYPISEIIRQNGQHLLAEVLGKGPRTFINERIINLSPVGKE